MVDLKESKSQNNEIFPNQMTTIMPFPFAFANAVIESKIKGSLLDDINFQKDDISKSDLSVKSLPKKEILKWLYFDSKTDLKEHMMFLPLRW